MTNIDAAGPAQSAPASQAEDTAPLARDFQDLLSGKGGAPAMVTITLAQGGRPGASQPGEFAKPVVITAVNGHGERPGGPGGLDAGDGSGAPGRGPLVITAVHGEQPTALPDAPEPGNTTLPRLHGGGPGHRPDFRVITTMHGGEPPTALPDAGPRLMTITAVREGGAASELPGMRVITMVHGGDRPSALPDAAVPRTMTITVVNKPE